MKLDATKHNELNGSLALVPQAFLNQMLEKQDKIITLLEKDSVRPPFFEQELNRKFIRFTLSI